ncbi:ankyrin repeat domain-containing protein [Aspergillus lucknowensis]|uniref:Ankyrin repeat-containing domain protein n=1 Tax=Aspergillus lucknowensis TaxID=176173 RepID=A0ABR4M198_9EURO
MGADPNGKSVDSRPAITAAAASGAWSTVRLLSTQGADLEVRDEENHTVLLRAFCCQSWDTVVSLLTSGANYRATTGEPSHITATSYAAENREWIQAELFVKAGADCNSRDTDGNPILVVAARARCWSMMRTLVKRGADVNAEDRNGKRALAYVLSEVKALLRVETDYASGEWQNVLDVVTLLLGKGATIGMKEAMTLSGGTNGQAVLEKFLNEYPQNMADDLKTPSKSSPEQVGSTLSPSPVTIRPPVRRKDHPAFRPPKEAFPARDKDSIDPGPSSGVPMPC